MKRAFCNSTKPPVFKKEEAKKTTTLVLLSLKFSKAKTLQKKRAVFGVSYATVHSEFFSQTLFDCKKSISGPIELKFSGKTLYAIL